MSKDKFLKFEFGKFPINGILCSSNSIDGYGPPTSTPILCETVVKVNDLFSLAGF